MINIEEIENRTDLFDGITEREKYLHCLGILGGILIERLNLYRY